MNKSRIETLREMLEKEPKDSFTRYAIGLEYMSLKEIDNAVIIFEEIIHTAPGYLPVYYQLGKAYEQRGETEKARTMYQRGIELAAEVNEIHTMDELQQALEDLF
jgi:tetratricopeptide (TPR) repeat protein